MASSSSSPSFKHEVFVSYRGKHMRGNIVSHLVGALVNKKILTFIDRKLPTMDELTSALIRAIEVSKISVIIFCERYAESPWCLDGLVKILECRKQLNQIVIPVFYKVNPTDVRNQTGEFGTAFHRLLNNFKNKEAEYTSALKNVCSISGFDSSTCGSEAALVNEIVDEVLQELNIGKYDIFVSFRGGDVDYVFTSHLFNSLQTKKIKTFCEDKDNRGDKISIIRAMEEAKIIIIIFSENYADCNWCLDELVQILECRDELNKIVIPVFYRIDPRNVRNQAGDFGTAFDRLLNNYRSKEEGWRSALKVAGAISGIDSSNYQPNDVLLNKIVHTVSGKLTDGDSVFSFYPYHDVFLSFRGEIRYHFVNHLVKALQRRNIQTFFDEELNRGDKISIALNRAIKRSKISVIIFSENYAGSRWCLDELVKTLQCMDERNQVVIPVFYEVDPANVQNQKGDFGNALDILVKDHKREEAGWRSALKNAGSIPDAIHSLSCSSGAILIDKIVSSIDDKLKMLKIQSDKEVGSHHPHNISTNPFGRFP